MFRNKRLPLDTEWYNSQRCFTHARRGTLWPQTDKLCPEKNRVSLWFDSFHAATLHDLKPRGETIAAQVFYCLHSSAVCAQRQVSEWFSAVESISTTQNLLLRCIPFPSEVIFSRPPMCCRRACGVSDVIDRPSSRIQNGVSPALLQGLAYVSELLQSWVALCVTATQLCWIHLLMRQSSISYVPCFWHRLKSITLRLCLTLFCFNNNKKYRRRLIYIKMNEE